VINVPFRLEGAPNFRDLGGKDIRGGYQVRHKRLFRSESLARLTDADLVRVASLNIALLYDLRGADERARVANRWPAGRAIESLTGLDSSDLDAVAFFGWRERIADPSFDVESARQWMTTAYAAMPRLFAGVLASLFSRLNVPEAPVTLVHCTAGKDRTGFVSAVLLLALGVRREEVFSDYLLTRQRRPPEQLLETLLGDEQSRYSPASRAALLTMADVREEYLGIALQTITHDFGSLEAYLSQACGLGPAQLTELRARLIE